MGRRKDQSSVRAAAREGSNGREHGGNASASPSPSPPPPPAPPEEAEAEAEAEAEEEAEEEEERPSVRPTLDISR
jgi:hypothetical protein